MGEKLKIGRWGKERGRKELVKVSKLMRKRLHRRERYNK